MLKKGQFDFWLRHDEPKIKVRDRSAFMNSLFNVDAIYTLKLLRKAVLAIGLTGDETLSILFNDFSKSHFYIGL